jgi:NTP pyrophosphatase (non-canonical NTP hydrolase)
MNSNQSEILSILQEECAEVIQAASKISRFGIDNFKPDKPKTNREHLEEELGDLMCMIQLLTEYEIVDSAKIDIAALNKRAKLRQWSTIFHS